MLLKRTRTASPGLMPSVAPAVRGRSPSGGRSANSSALSFSLESSAMSSLGSNGGILSLYQSLWKGTPPPPPTPELGWRSSEEFVATYVTSQEVLGTGSFGEVRVAKHKQSGHEVAVKTMGKTRKRFTRQKTLEKIRREARMLRDLQCSPSVVRLIELYESRDDVHITMELCRGGDLRRFVQTQGALDEKAIAGVALQALKFIQSCHEQGILYGDLKPANLCLVNTVPKRRAEAGALPLQEVQVKAVDFGNSQFCGESHRLTKWRGTLTFLSPEVYSRNYGHKTDMWALGITLYWLFCARYPFWPTAEPPALSSVDEMAAVVSSAPIRYDFGPWLTMSTEGLDFMQRCLERDELARISVQEALRHPWLSLMLAAPST